MDQPDISDSAIGSLRAGMPLPPKTLLGFSLAVVAVVIIALLSYQSLQATTSSARNLAQSIEVLSRLQALLSTLKDAETGQRGYLLTGEEAYLAPYTEAKEALPGEFKATRAMLHDRPEQLRQLEMLESVTNSRMAELESTIAARRAGHADAALAVTRTDRGKMLMDRVRATVNAMNAAERQWIARHGDESETAATISLAVSWGGSGVLLILIAGAAAVAARDFRARQAQAWIRSKDRQRLEELLQETQRQAQELQSGQEELRVSNEELEEQRRALSARLTNRIETLRVNEMFNALLAHDLRSPLSAILASARLLERRSSETVALETAARIVASGNRMARMIEDMLDLARARLGGGIPVNREPADFKALVERVMREHQAAVPDRSVEAGYEGQFNGYWDAERIAQAASNLIGNALKHGSAPAPVRVRLDGTDDESILLIVKNSGAIPQDVLPHLFDPFRGGGHQSGRSDGLGLGLYIVSQIVQAHGGTVDVKTGDGDTAFYVRLPRGAP